MANFKVFHEDYMGDKPREMTEKTFIGAAQEYAQWYNTRADYALMKEEEEIFVEDGNGLRKKFSISAEASIEYNVTELPSDG